jgi:hypothetical protein
MPRRSHKDRLFIAFNVSEFANKSRDTPSRACSASNIFRPGWRRCSSASAAIARRLEWAWRTPIPGVWHSLGKGVFSLLVKVAQCAVAGGEALVAPRAGVISGLTGGVGFSARADGAQASIEVPSRDRRSSFPAWRDDCRGNPLRERRRHPGVLTGDDHCRMVPSGVLQLDVAGQQLTAECLG